MMRPLRIAMVTEYAYPVLGGISEHVHFLSRELAQLGHDVTVVTSHPPHGHAGRRRPDRRRAPRRRGLSHGAHRSFDSRGLQRVDRARVGGAALKRRLGRVQAPMDVVHAQGLAGALMALWSLRASKAPCTVGTFHTYFDGGHIAYRVMHPYIATALGNADRKIAVSDACVMSTGQYFPDEVFDIVPNGIDTEFFSPVPRPEARLEGPARILFVGRFDPRNGLGTLLDAAAILQARGYDFEVQVVGDGPAAR